MLTVSYASSMRAYLQQRAHINDLKTQIAAARGRASTTSSARSSAGTTRRTSRQQARDRFGYVMPGETSYLVLDENGEPLEPQTRRCHDPTDVLAADADRRGRTTPGTSVELAGNPPKADRPPATEIDGIEQGTGGEGSAGEAPEAP